MPVRPKPAVVKRFLEEQIHLDMMQVKSIQLHNVRNNTLIEMYNSEAADLLAEEHNLKHSLEHNNKLYQIPVYVDDGATNVRVHDLPPGFANDRIVKHMRQFGEVISIEDEKWTNFFPGVPNGVRVLRMRLSRAIPSFVEVDNEKTLVTYTHQTPTCRHCGRQVHFTMKCSEAAKQERQTTRPASGKAKTPDELLEKDFPALPVPKEVLEAVEILGRIPNNQNSEDSDRDESQMDDSDIEDMARVTGRSRSISPIDYQYLVEPAGDADGPGGNQVGHAVGTVCAAKYRVGSAVGADGAEDDRKISDDDGIVYQDVKPANPRKSRSKTNKKGNGSNGKLNASRSRSNSRKH